MWKCGRGRNASADCVLVIIAHQFRIELLNEKYSWLTRKQESSILSCVAGAVNNCGLGVNVCFVRHAVTEDDQRRRERKPVGCSSGPQTVFRVICWKILNYLFRKSPENVDANVIGLVIACQFVTCDNFVVVIGLLGMAAAIQTENDPVGNTVSQNMHFLT